MMSPSALPSRSPPPGWARWPIVAAIVAAVWVGVWAAGVAAEPPRRRIRARPPQPDRWDGVSRSAFLDDAFSSLDGERPDFAAARTVGPGAAPGAATGAGPGAPAGGFRWSTLVSPDTLADEVKEQRRAVAAAVESESAFKGGGYEDARNAYSAVALAFGLAAAHDGEVRWKKDAANARDLFARVGFNCKVGTTNSFKEAKERFTDLETLLDGGSPENQADREEDFLWSQVAARPALMSRLEAAEGVAAAAIASKGDFERDVETLTRELEIVAAIGEVIQQGEFEFFDDDTYKSYSAAMRDAAVRGRDAARKGDYDGARAAVGELKKSCDTCHGDYRS